MQHFKRLRCWEKAADVAAKVIEVTQQLPPVELYGLIAQMRRSAGSIASNIAEGRARGGDKEFARFLDIAFGFACELESQLIIATRAGMISAPELEREIDILKGMIYGFRRLLRVGGKRRPDSAMRC